MRACVLALPLAASSVAVSSVALAGGPPKPQSFGEVEQARPSASPPAPGDLETPPPSVIGPVPSEACEPPSQLPWVVAGAASVGFVLAVAWAIRERTRFGVVNEELSRIRIHRTSMVRASAKAAAAKTDPGAAGPDADDDDKR